MVHTKNINKMTASIKILLSLAIELICKNSKEAFRILTYMFL